MLSLVFDSCNHAYKSLKQWLKKQFFNEIFDYYKVQFGQTFAYFQSKIFILKIFDISIPTYPYTVSTAVVPSFPIYDPYTVRLSQCFLKRRENWHRKGYIVNLLYWMKRFLGPIDQRLFQVYHFVRRLRLKNPQ